MFMVFNKEKILSYLISLSTVALLFVISFAITKRNDEILKTSANAISSNSIADSIESTATIENAEMLETDSELNPNANSNLIKSENPNANSNLIKSEKLNANSNLIETKNSNVQGDSEQTQNPNARENLIQTENPNVDSSRNNTKNSNISKTEDKTTENNQ